MSKQSILRTEELRKEFGELIAVDGVSLDINQGEFFSLLGPSGCGKTTTLRMLAGLETPTSGDIYLGEKRVNDQPSNKRKVNMVFQDLVLFPHMTVFENIAYGPKRAGMDKDEIEERVNEMLEIIDLPDYGDRDINELSGGEQQRVALARALINQPKVLLLDEPLASLDEKLKKQMQFELTKIQREVDTTFMYVTHDQDSAMSMSDRMAVMNHGELVEVGPPDELYVRPRTEFVADFLGDANIFTGNVIKQNGTGATVRLSNGYEGNALTEGVPDTKDGDDVTVMVRPENVKLVEPGKTDVAGNIESKTYKGFYTEYEIQVQNEIIKAREDRDETPFERGDTVSLEFSEVKVVE